jgi:hypothetical protein
VTCAFKLLKKEILEDSDVFDEMGRTCGTYGGEKRCLKGFSGKT